MASGAGFGAMAVFGKEAYGQGTTVATLLSVRFAFAAVVFWAIVLATGAARELRTLGRRDIALGLLLGACGYAGQAACYFVALSLIEASLLSLLLYTYPAIVAAAAVALGRERLDGRILAALALALGGLVLALAGAGMGTIDPVGAGLGVCAATIYATYILVSQRVVARVRPAVLTPLVCTGAAVSLTIGAALIGQLRPGDVTLGGWGWLVCLALVSTVAAVSLFFGGLKRVGPTTASILSTMEPVTTLVLAFLVFGETLGAIQLAGGALVISAVVVVSAGRRSRSGARYAEVGALGVVEPATE
jgi:drug/metabolite transporter (DMT)-like permease